MVSIVRGQSHMGVRSRRGNQCQGIVGKVVAAVVVSRLCLDSQFGEAMFNRRWWSEGSGDIGSSASRSVEMGRRVGSG